MILNHVADSARFVIENAPTLNAEVFRHSDLHAFDMVAVPERLQGCVGEAEEKQVMHGPLAEVMVNAEDGLFVERLANG